MNYKYLCIFYKINTFKNITFEKRYVILQQNMR